MNFDPLTRSHRCWQRVIRPLVLFLAVVSFPGLVQAQSSAKSLFGELKQWVFQVRVIDLASGDKFSLGSGFQVTAGGMIATNFHVVSAYVHEPEKYRLEVVLDNGDIQNATLSDFDVIHDLALMQVEGLPKSNLTLNTKPLVNGDRIYSMGNPHDLGMTIVEGNYNGLIKTSRYQKLLFSGSLNSGMSGGPAMDENGHIIGINVSTGGEQISFLVPVSKLVTLLESAGETPAADQYVERIRDALMADQQQFYGSLLETEFKLEPLGPLNLPGEISETLKCWGHTVDTDEEKYEAVHQHCSSQDSIFIHRGLSAGEFTYDSEWLNSDGLNRFQFYNKLQSRFSHRTGSNAYSDEDISEYQCHTDFIQLANHDWKASTCFRAYLDYEGLYDAIFMMASVDINDAGAVIKTGARGISRDNAMALIRKMMESVQWKP